jgi:hypothetical protein
VRLNAFAEAAAEKPELEKCQPAANPRLLFTQIRSNQKRLARLISVPQLALIPCCVKVDVRLEWRLDMVSRADCNAHPPATLRFVCPFAAFGFLGG